MLLQQPASPPAQPQQQADQPSDQQQQQSDTPPDQQQPGGFHIGVAVNQIFLSVNARSVQGGFVKGLTKDDFVVLEDNVKQQIGNFYSEAVPLHVVLLVDTSGSTYYTQSEIRRAALEFAKKLKPEDKVAIISFNSNPVLIQDWTNDIKKVEVALQSIYPKGNTVLNDALYVTFDDLLKDVDGKKAVILLTDGMDTGSNVTFESALNLAVRSEAAVYVVSKVDDYWSMAIAARNQNPAYVPKELTDGYIISVKRSLQRLADLTGGKLLDAKAFASLTDVYASVAEELRNQYYISYIPVNIMRDGKWRTIEIHCLKPGVIASTRPGYFAPDDHQAVPR